MVNDDGKPMAAASRRRIRTQAEWNVDTHILWATDPTSVPTRAFISSAALLVKVMARMENGLAPCSWISHAMRRVSTRVLPEPAPASTSSGPPRWVTAASCAGLRPSSKDAPKGPEPDPMRSVGSGNSSPAGSLGSGSSVDAGTVATLPATPDSSGVPLARRDGRATIAPVRIHKLSSTDAFVAFDLDDTPSVGVTRLARKVLTDGAELLARSTTYAFASFGVRMGGASAGINAEGDGRDPAVAAFVEEMRSAVADGRWATAPAPGRPEARRVGKECGSTCRSRGAPVQ